MTSILMGQRERRNRCDVRFTREPVGTARPPLIHEHDVHGLAQRRHPSRCRAAHRCAALARSTGKQKQRDFGARGCRAQHHEVDANLSALPRRAVFRNRQQTALSRRATPGLTGLKLEGLAGERARRDGRSDDADPTQADDQERSKGSHAGEGSIAEVIWATDSGAHRRGSRSGPPRQVAGSLAATRSARSCPRRIGGQT
jgi:hypothetical protein